MYALKQNEKKKKDIPMYTPILLYKSAVQGGLLSMDVFS